MTSSIAQDAYLDRRSRLMTMPERDYRTAGEKLYDCPATFEVMANWNFRSYDFGTWIDAETGKQVLFTMEVVNPDDATSRFLVTFDLRINEWRCICPSFRAHFGQTMIWAVQLRIENNKRERLGAN